MRFILDTADVREVREAVGLGLLDGVNTLAGSAAGPDGESRGLLREVLSLFNGPVSAPVNADDREGMLSQGRELAGLHPNVVVQVPPTRAGLEACRTLRSEGANIDVTLCFSPGQALLAAKAGATYVSPAFVRTDDSSHDGPQLIRLVRAIYDNYGFETRIVAAAIRNPSHAVAAALAGADAAALPFSVALRLLDTDAGMEEPLIAATKPESTG